ncbi:DUF6331 family protein [Pseudomonas sp. JZ134]|uniref:DUF6331 family protein n=1 Tax=Pseudomonas sp. JZ134 TaxID=2806615 RepID=UPI003DA1A365
MRLEDPLLNMVSKCQTLCVAECCGADAFDFSPIHIASYLIMWEGKPNPNSVAKLRSQLEFLKASYGSSTSSASGVTIHDMNQEFASAEIDALVDEITANLELALRLCTETEKRRYGSIEQRAGADGEDAAAQP